MSAEHFTTFLTADMRTDPEDASKAQTAEAGTQQPRFADGVREGAWAMVYLRAEDVLKIAAETIRGDEMDGITGDHPDKREQIAKVIDETARAVRALALDHACDGAITESTWMGHLLAIMAAAHHKERAPYDEMAG